MNVGIMVYSHTGNTLSVALKLQEALNEKGHTATIERVVPVESKPQAKGKTSLQNAPDVTPYDAVVFASPVYGFALAPAMLLYLSQISSLADKKAACFVTMNFKFKWLGGNHSVRQITAACKEKGADVLKSGIVSWESKSRDEEIAAVVSRLTF